ncbi:MAG: acyltransferase [Hyphomonadaceae bacterium]
MKDQLESVQILRAIAALAVVVFHYGGALRDDFGLLGFNPFVSGSDGVDIFFVISGFIMCYTTARPDQRSPGGFAMKRIARIIPLYYVLTVGLFALGAVAPTLLSSGAATPEELVKSLLFIPYERSSGAVQPVLFLGWTLNYEMFFYALFVIALLVAPAIRIQAVSGAIIALVAAGYLTAGSVDNVVWRFYTSGILLEFVFGCLVFVLYDRWPGVVRAMAPLWIVGAAALIGQTFYNLPLPREVEKGLPAAIVVISVLGMQLKQGAVSRAFARIGDASYSLYLGHPYVVELVAKVAIAVLGATILSGILTGVVAVAVSVGVAMLSFALIERPSNNWIRRRLAARRQPTVP